MSENETQTEGQSPKRGPGRPPLPPADRKRWGKWRIDGALLGETEFLAAALAEVEGEVPNVSEYVRRALDERNRKVARYLERRGFDLDRASGGTAPNPSAVDHG